MPSGNSPAVQWLGFHAFTADGMDSIPGWGTKILKTVQCGQRKKNMVSFCFAI